MDNIWFFLITVSVYSAIAISFGDYIRVSLKKFFKVIVTAMLLALPIDIGGNVFTIAGNAVAEKNIYSLFSVYQQAGQDAVTGLGLAYQRAGQNAVTGLGLAYQRAGQNAVTGLGLAYQRAGQNAVTGLGLAYQRAGQNAVTGLGLAIYQKAGRGARVPISIALYQRVGEKTRAFGAFLSLTKD